MEVWRQIRSWGTTANWAAGAAGLVVVLLLATAQSGSLSGGSVLRALAGTTAGFLLVMVATASLHEDHRRRILNRHLSIRADIAAGGGLGKRLMV